MTFQDRIDEPRVAKLTVKDYLLLEEAGAFERYSRTQLIEGEIWIMNAIHRRHARMQAMLTVEIGIALKRIGSELELYSPVSTELSEDSLPEPDIVLSDPTEGDLLQGPAVRLSIEVSDASLALDMGRKARLYARTGVPEYWVVDVQGGVVRQMWGADGERYTETREVTFGEEIAAATIESLSVTVPIIR